MTSLGKWLMVVTRALVPVLVSCRRSPINNVNNAPITAPKRLTLNDVHGAIERAGHGLTTTSFSISYRDSKDLNYDGSNIHSNYNNWIHNLDQAIQQQLAAL
jgi:hypothetical protein